MNIFKKTILLSIVILYTTFSNFSNVFGKDAIYKDKDLDYNVTSNNVAVLDLNTDILLYGKNEHEPVFPASTTKLMTALLLIENTKDFDTERITFTTEAVTNLEYNAVTIGMNNGDTLSVRDALYGLLLSSANEVANAIAINVSGSVEQFGKQMTLRAKQLGAQNTNFTNPSGLHNDNHYSTAYDMALIMQEISKYDIYTEIASTDTYEIAPTETYPKVRKLFNTNKLINPASIYYNEDVKGSKTGYTSKAGFNLTTYAKNPNNIPIAVSTLNSTKTARFLDTNELLDFAFNSYANVNVSKQVNIIETILIPETNKVMYKPIPTEDMFLHIPKNIDKTDFRYVTNITENISTNTEKGTLLGTVDFYLKNHFIGSSDLVLNDELTVVKGTNTTIHPNFYNVQSLNAVKNSKTIGSTFIRLLKFSTFAILACIAVIFYLNSLEKQKRKKINKKIYYKKKRRPKRTNRKMKSYQSSNKLNQRRRGRRQRPTNKRNSI